MTQAPELPPLHMRRDTFNPTAELREIRETDGVRTITSAFGMDVFLVTRHEDVKTVLSDHERFSNGRPPGFVVPGAPNIPEEEQASARAGNLLGLDPPEHQRLRRMLTAEFTIRRMKRLQERVVEIVDAQLDAMEKAGPPADLVASFALPIPSLVICELLGVPYEDREDFQQRSTRQLDLSLPISERLELVRRGRAYMATLVERSRRNPGEDILGMLVRDHGHELTDDELVGVASLLLLAGHETTSNMLGLGTLALLRHPDQLAAVRDDRRCRNSGRTAGLRVAAVWQSRPGVHRRTGGARHPSRRAGTSGVRSRRPSLSRRSAGPHGDADRVSGSAAPLSDVGDGRGLHRCALPVVPLHLRSEIVGGSVVMAP